MMFFDKIVVPSSSGTRNNAGYYNLLNQYIKSQGLDYLKVNSDLIGKYEVLPCGIVRITGLYKGYTSR